MGLFNDIQDSVGRVCGKKDDYEREYVPEPLKKLKPRKRKSDAQLKREKEWRELDHLRRTNRVKYDIEMDLRKKLRVWIDEDSLKDRCKLYINRREIKTTKGLRIKYFWAIIHYMKSMEVDEKASKWRNIIELKYNHLQELGWYIGKKRVDKKDREYSRQRYWFVLITDKENAVKKFCGKIVLDWMHGLVRLVYVTSRGDVTRLDGFH